MLSSFSLAERKLWLQWVLAAVVGPALATTIAQLASSYLPQLGDNRFLFIPFLLALSTPKILIEWRALRPYLAQSWWWIPASLAGELIDSRLVSIAQWLFLRRRVQRAFWWPIAGYLIIFLGTIYLGLVGQSPLTLIILWLAQGGVAGWLMVVLLRQPLGPDDRHEFDVLAREIEARLRDRQAKRD